jgi:hypothetical protein
MALAERFLYQRGGYTRRVVHDFLSGSDGSRQRWESWWFNICTEMEAAGEPVGCRVASLVSLKPSISIAVTGVWSFHAKRIPLAFPTQ